MTKYAILLIETGEYLYSVDGDSEANLRSTEEQGSIPNDRFKPVIFNSKEKAYRRLVYDNQFIILNNEKIITSKNLNLFEIVEIEE